MSHYNTRTNRNKMTSSEKEEEIHTIRSKYQKLETEKKAAAEAATEAATRTIKEEQTELVFQLRKLKKEKQEAIKKEQAAEKRLQKAQEALLKEQFDIALPSHLERLDEFNVLLKKAKKKAIKAAEMISKIEDDKLEYMHSFYNKCVHSYGETYSQYSCGDEYKNCIYCGHELCIRECYSM